MDAHLVELFRQMVEAAWHNGTHWLSNVKADDAVGWAKGLYGMAKAWLEKRQDKKEKEQLRRDLEQLANQTDPDVIRAYIDEAVRQALTTRKGAPPADEEIIDLELYLSAVPDAVRQSFKRRDDPTGRTVPVGFALNSPDDVVRMFPPRPPRFRPNDPLPGRPGWVLERLLGVGGFGEVWLARNTKTRSLFGAVKFCFDQSGRDLIQEAGLIDRIMAAGEHPNIVPLKDVHLDGDTPWLMFEYVGGGTLTDHIHELAALPVAERTAKALAALSDLCAAVAHFHALPVPVVHRDLKPSNILLCPKSGRLRVTDFGIGAVTAREANRQESRGQTSLSNRLMTYLRGSHTPLYSSPQQRNGSDPDPRDDVHALGVIGYQMLTGHLDRGASASFVKDLARAGVPERVVKLLDRCIEHTPDDRPADGVALLTDLQVRDATVPLVAPAAPPVVMPAAQVLKGELPPLPVGILQSEGKVDSLARTVACLEDGTHPDLSASVHALAGHGHSVSDVVARLLPVIEADPNGSVAAWCRTLPNLPPQLLTPIISAVQHRIHLQKELDTETANLIRQQREDFHRLVDTFLAHQGDRPFPLPVWNSLWTQFEARRYRFAASGIDLLHAAQERYAERQREESLWTRVTNSNDAQGFREYLQKYPSGRHADKASELLKKQERRAEQERTTQSKRNEIEQQAAREKQAADLRNRLLKKLDDRNVRREYLMARTERLKSLDGRVSVWYWWLLIPTVCVIAAFLTSSILFPTDPDTSAPAVFLALASPISALLLAVPVVFWLLGETSYYEDGKKGWDIVGCLFFPPLVSTLVAWPVIAIWGIDLAPLIGGVSGLVAIFVWRWFYLVVVIREINSYDDNPVVAMLDHMGNLRGLIATCPRTAGVYNYIAAVITGFIVSLGLLVLLPSIQPLRFLACACVTVAVCVGFDLVYRRNRFRNRQELGPLPWYVDGSLEQLRKDYL